MADPQQVKAEQYQVISVDESGITVEIECSRCHDRFIFVEGERQWPVCSCGCTWQIWLRVWGIPNKMRESTAGRIEFDEEERP